MNIEAQNKMREDLYLLMMKYDKSLSIEMMITLFLGAAFDIVKNYLQADKETEKNFEQTMINVFRSFPKDNSETVNWSLQFLQAHSKIFKNVQRSITIPPFEDWPLSIWTVPEWIEDFYSMKC